MDRTEGRMERSILNPPIQPVWGAIDPLELVPICSHPPFLKGTKMRGEMQEGRFAWFGRVEHSFRKQEGILPPPHPDPAFVLGRTAGLAGRVAAPGEKIGAGEDTQSGVENVGACQQGAGLGAGG